MYVDTRTFKRAPKPVTWSDLGSDTGGGLAFGGGGAKFENPPKPPGAANLAAGLNWDAKEGGWC